jgi:hypothetical protein
MKRRWFVFLLGMLVMTLAGCSVAGDLPQPPVGGEATRPPFEVVEGALPPRPDEVTRDFYEWYLGVSETTNPLVSGIYRDHENLSPAFVEAVDATLASFDGQGGFDPILLAQDVPVQIEVGEPVVSGQEATVTVLRHWGGNPDPSPMTVSLIHAGDRWLIDAVSADVAIEPAMMAWWLPPDPPTWSRFFMIGTWPTSAIENRGLFATRWSTAPIAKAPS